MNTKFGALALSTAVLLSAAACSKKDEPVTPAATTAAAGGSTTTTASAGSSSTTAKPDDTKKSTTTAKDDTDTTKKTGGSSKLPTKNLELTSDEEACVDGAMASGLEESPEMADDELKLAGFTGGVIAGCVDKEKIAAAIIKKVKEVDPSAKQSVLDCANDELIKFDKTDLALVVAGILLENKELLADADKKITEKCGS